MTAEQLKNSILQMAVSGKLVPQNPNDEPASVLLERIRKEKEQLIKEGKIKKEKNPSYIFRGTDNTPYEKVGNNESISIADEVPFEIPDNWAWVRASSLGKMIRGKGIKRTETVDEGLPCVRYGEIYTSYDIEFSTAKSFIPSDLYGTCLHLSKGDVVFTLTGENKVDIAKAVAYVGDTPVAAGGDMAFWTAHGMNPLYLVYYMASPYCIEQKRRTATGDIIVHISTEKVGRFLVPVPPIEEQNRIVEQLRLIESKLGKYKEIETELTILNNEFPDNLKKSIIQMAVSGKLTKQDPSDESASVLLERIHAEKEHLIREGKIKRDKNESIIYRKDNSHYEMLNGLERCIDDEIPFEIPDSWRWVRLSTIAQLLGGYAFKSTNYCATGIRVIRISDFDQNGLLYKDYKYYKESPELEKYAIKANDILMCMTGGTVGKACLLESIDKKMYLNQRVALIRSLPFVLAQYLFCFLVSPYIKGEIALSRTSTNDNISMETISSFLCPLPPYSEQKRIVEAISKLTGEIDMMN